MAFGSSAFRKYENLNSIKKLESGVASGVPPDVEPRLPARRQERVFKPTHRTASRKGRKERKGWNVGPFSPPPGAGIPVLFPGSLRAWRSSREAAFSSLFAHQKRQRAAAVQNLADRPLPH